MFYAYTDTDHCQPCVFLYQKDGFDSCCDIKNLLLATYLYIFYYYNKYRNISVHLNIFITAISDFFKHFSWCIVLSWSVAQVVFLILDCWAFVIFLGMQYFFIVDVSKISKYYQIYIYIYIYIYIKC